MKKAFLQAFNREQGLFSKIKEEEKGEIASMDKKSLKYDTPGPGHYLGVDAARKMRNVPSVKIKNGPPRQMDIKDTPGPGEYEQASCTSSVAG